MPAPENPDHKAIALVKQSYTESTGHRVVDTLEFLDGALRIIAYFDDGNDEECYVFTGGNGKSRLLSDVTEIALHLGKPQPTTLIERILASVGVPGFLAVIITIAILYLAVTSRQIPEVLGHSLTAILGFYFGTKFAK